VSLRMRKVGLDALKGREATNAIKAIAADTRFSDSRGAAMMYLTMVACSNKNGMILSKEYELSEFMTVHWKELERMLDEVLTRE